jgi:HEAT repeat protein
MPDLSARIRSSQMKVSSQCWLLWVSLLSLVLTGGCGSSSEEQQIKKRLTSPNAVIRAKAITEAEAKPSASLRSELLRMFDDENELPIVRSAAGMALAHLHDTRVVESALKQIPTAVASALATNSNRQMDTLRIGKTLAAFGPESMVSLAPLLKDKRREVAAWAIALHGVFRRNDQALQVLANAMKNPDPIYRRSAAYGLALLFHPQAEPILVRYLDDPDAEVRYHVAWGLENYGTVASSAALERQMAREREPQVKQELTTAVASVKMRMQVPVAPPASNPVVAPKKSLR